MPFQAIQGPDGPEEFAWEVTLGPEQELRQVDDRHAGVGRVRGERDRAAHVVRQFRLAGKTLPAWTAVDVKAS